ncbi:MAG: hypothetical protein AAGB32_02495 [Pseudomonadota bacterium]
MMSQKILGFGLIVSTLAITACSPTIYNPTKKLEDARYWQRASASSALYLRGPKAQQMLHQDIAICKSSIDELKRLGEIRDAIPANYNTGNEMHGRTASQQKLDEWETPERDGYLRNEHLEYADFETCMVTKGWERAEFLTYDEAELAREDYANEYLRKQRKKGIGDDREYVTTINQPAPKPGNELNLNN